MAKTFQEIQKDLAYIFRSTIDPDDMELDSQDEEEYLNVASSCYTEAIRILNENDFDFSISVDKFKTKAGKSTYNGVTGQILNNGVTIEGSTDALKYEAINTLKEQVDRPSKFWLDTDENIVLYPIPDDIYNVTVRYKDARYFYDDNEGYLYEPIPTATLRMPERLQAPFIEWLKYETLANYIKNQAKPRYQPIINKAEQLKLAFLKTVNGYKEPARMIL